MSCFIWIIFFINLINHGCSYVDMTLPDHKNAFDLDLYEAILDSELCDVHISYLRNDTQLLLEFLDAGIRTPRGIFTANFLDLGNYHQCLALHHSLDAGDIEGKYCLLEIPFSQENLTLPDLPEFPEWPEIPWPDLPWPELNPNTSRISPETRKRWELYQRVKNSKMWPTDEHHSSRSSNGQLSGAIMNVALCLPKTCTSHEFMSKMFTNLTSFGFEYRESFCRVPGDKPWVTADYVMIVTFSLIGIITIMSTYYDIRHTVLLKRDPKHVNKLYQSFSLYTNTRRLVTYTPVPGAIECLDGIRALAMMWVIVGHTFVNQLNILMANIMECIEWMISLRAVWITAGPIAVDTFFMLSGLLIVYTTTGKMTSMKLLKNLHLFYLNRLLRMFPILASVMLLQASMFNWIADGPYWFLVADKVERCRLAWWPTLLYIQNYYSPANICMGHTWYLAIDVQLHILSPIILFWVLKGRKRFAWLALLAGLGAFLVGSSIYNFYKEFPPAPLVLSRSDDRYMVYYYINTLTRASPFFVGMIFGYILHLYRGQKVIMSKIQAMILWICALALTCLVVYTSYPIIQMDWDNQTVDSLINSYKRPAWALSLGWYIFACFHGYGGPVNWLLSLRAWKLLSRLSYAMYIVHHPLIYVVNSTAVAPIYFSVQASIFKFFADFTLAAIVAFILTVLVDSPFSTLIKMVMGPGPRRIKKSSINEKGVGKLEDTTTRVTIKTNM